jgi:hypothetical protein
MKRKLLSLFLAFSALTAFSQKNYWKTVSENTGLTLNSGKSFFNNGFLPAAYKLFTLSETDLTADLSSAKGITAVIIYLPVANGSVEKFSIRSYSVMEPALQAKYADIKAFSGTGVDDPSKSVVLTFTKLGLHASIRSLDKNTMYVNPLNNRAKLYAVFERNENDRSENKLKCETDEFISTQKITANKLAPAGNIDDGKLRTYRLALCTTGEFSRYLMTGSEVTTQDSINTVMASVTVDLARANQVYETDLGIHMNFVANEDTLIFLNPANDPFTTSTLNSKCQQTCDNRIGNANYDVGHVVHKDADNGNAGCIGCVCRTGSKGSGFSTYSHPDLTDYFVIDYWTHEMGHQYGANHTYTFSNEGTNAQIEPGSGSTIMGYAGITGNTDVQPHSDDLFSAASIAQISVYVKTGNGSTCPVVTTTGNHAPTANAGADRVVPMLTPFRLTGSGTDADGDNISYIWEQVDAFEGGANTFPKTTTAKGPEFRTYNYSTAKVRSFPPDSTVLRGATGFKWESLSGVDRDLNFRFTVRDNHAGGGNNKSDNVLIKVTSAAGPFKITSPNTAVSWVAGTTKTITWDVANTNLAPVNCANVKIMLSTNGGKTFTQVLKANTPNDGSEQIVVPDVATNKARIAIVSVGNIFYDFSDANFTITPAGVVSAGVNDADEMVAANNVSSVIKPNPAREFFTVTFNASANNVSLVLSDANGKTMVARNLHSIVKGQTEIISVHNFIKGSYFLKITTENGVQTQKVIVQ